MNVLSVFDGISCGRLALKKAGIKVDKYYASEIDKHAIKVTMNKNPDTIQLGDVTKIKYGSGGEDTGLSNDKFYYPCMIDLLIGGSPCQGFSFAGKQLNFEDPRSKLFFEFIRLLKEIRVHNPQVKFLLENVKMKKEYQDVISDLLGVQPIEINSALVSAQNRKRLYWTNIEGVRQPEDRGILLKDILDSENELNPSAIRGRYLNKATILGRRLNEKGKREDYNKNIKITQCLEVRSSNTDKSNCLTTVEKDNVLTSLSVGRYPDAFKNKLPFRYYSEKEICRLQTIPEDYFGGLISKNQIVKTIGNSWTVDVIAHIFSYMNIT